MIRIEGRGLRTGAPCSIRFDRAAGPLLLRASGSEAVLSDVSVVDATRATTIAIGDARVATVEHLFAALAAADVREGLVVTFEGPETPFVDGAARTFLDAVLGLEIAPSPSRLRVVREATIERYSFAPAAEASLEVRIDFGDARLAPVARWDGSLSSFRRDIASARTFALAEEVEALADRGLVAHVAKESVIVLASDEILSAGAPFAAEEPARHKLLDLVGDLFLWGGPPRGRILASRPGHAATHDVMRKAIDAGIVEFTRV